MTALHRLDLVLPDCAVTDTTPAIVALCLAGGGCRRRVPPPVAPPSVRRLHLDVSDNRSITSVRMHSLRSLRHLRVVLRYTRITEVTLPPDVQTLDVSLMRGASRNVTPRGVDACRVDSVSIVHGAGNNVRRPGPRLQPRIR